MEKDNEVKGIGNSLDFGARIYDSRLGRWLSLDPLQAKYPSLSPYTFCANSPLFNVDPDGRIIIPIHGTWSNPNTWQDLIGIRQASYNLFRDGKLGANYRWSGGNYTQSRTEAALE